MEKKKALGYIRVSTERQALEGYSLDNQLKEIKEFCHKESIELVDYYADEGISGASIEKREGLLEALDVITRRKDIQYLIVWKSSRLARNIADVVNIIEVLEDSDSYLRSVTEKIDTSDKVFGKFMLLIGGIFAEIERDNLITQVKGGMKEKARQGHWNGGFVPLGYALEEKKIYVIEEEAQIVKEIFELYLQGNGYSEIARQLNSKGYKTKKGMDFSNNSVKGCLVNPTYKGYIRWGRLKDWNKKHRKEGGTAIDKVRKRKYDDTVELYKGIHEAIISEEMFDEVQKKIATNPRSHVKRFNGNHLLSGLLRCPKCGYGMSVVHKNGYSYYECNLYANKRTCDAKRIRKDKIEPEFYSIFNDFVNNEDIHGLLKNGLNKTASNIGLVEKQIKNKNKQISKLKAQSKETLQNYVQAPVDMKEGLHELYVEEMATLSTLKSDLYNLEENLNELNSKTIDLDAHLEMLKEASVALQSIEENEVKQRLIRMIIKSIKTIDGHISEIEFNFNEVFRVNRDNLHLLKCEKPYKSVQAK